MTIKHLPVFLQKHYHVFEWRHACAVLENDFPQQWSELTKILGSFRLRRSLIVNKGGNRSPVVKELDGAFYSASWEKKEFKTSIVVDGKGSDNPTHEIDCYKGGVALETEWDNKDPFFDRDLNNFRILFELRSVSVGVIITRSRELDSLITKLRWEAGTSKEKFGGANTTHWDALIPRIQGGGGGGCPVLAFGMKPNLYVDDR